MTNKKIAVLLSGSGVFDGSEINEAVLTLLALEENGFEFECFAVDMEQHHTINHKDSSLSESTRNVLDESARIVRGDIKSISDIDYSNFDALIVIGGFGVAKNYSNFAFEGANFKINPLVEQFLKTFKEQNKPAGYMCIAPVLLPLIYKSSVVCTIGNDPSTAEAINSRGGKHVECEVDQIVVDKENNVVSTPAYMLASSLLEAKSGIDKLVSQIKTMVS